VRAVIELCDVRKVFSDPHGGEVVAVDGVSVTIGDGETLCLIGTSGCGKTTTMKLINRLIEPSAGQILIDGSDVRDRDVIELRRGIGYVIQKGGLFPHMTVTRNVGLLCELEGWEQGDIDRRVGDLLALVNLPSDEFGARYPSELSGGQRQRIGVARALALDPPVILMDEPFGALDPITRSQIHEEFRQLKDTVDKTIIIVTHDMSEAFMLGDKVALMDAGRIVQHGSEEDFRERPANDFVAQFLESHLGNGAGH
jgi:osmoprotectant transport system ATP-binding protein